MYPTVLDLHQVEAIRALVTDLAPALDTQEKRVAALDSFKIELFMVVFKDEFEADLNWAERG